jgi:N-acetylneuraminic acid mutarotase
MKSTRLIMLIVISMILVACEKSGWTERVDMPTARWEHDTCVVDGKIYVIGGAGPEYQALGTVEVYDPVANSWEAKSDMPTVRQGLSTSVVNGKIYAIGGIESDSSAYMTADNFSTVEEYDPANDTWSTKTPMPTARGWHSANVVDGKIYIIGGSRGASPSDMKSSAVEVYDPETDSWSQKGFMPEAKGAGSGSIVDGKIYIFGGYGGPKRVDEYDPLTDTWTQKSDMPTRRIGLSTSVVDGKIYVTGGFVPGHSGYPGITTVEVYDPATDTWTTAPDMPTGRFGAYTSVVDGKIYVFGGLPSWPASAYGIVEVYNP